MSLMKATGTIRVVKRTNHIQLLLNVKLGNGRATKSLESSLYNPALVMGHHSLMLVNQAVLKYYNNLGWYPFGVPPMWNGIVDVRDVADAHVAAALNPKQKVAISCVVELKLTRNGWH
jgi:hypothetical protein